MLSEMLKLYLTLESEYPGKDELQLHLLHNPVSYSFEKKYIPHPIVCYTDSCINELICKAEWDKCIL